MGISEKIRCFIALDLPEEIKRQLGYIIEELQKSLADVKWVKQENLHLTLKFLGEQDEKKVKKVKEILELLSSQQRSYALALGSLGGFPKLEYPRVIWIGLSKGEKETLEIAEELENQISKLGIPKEKRAFSSHITLGRVRSGLNREKLIRAIKDFSLPQEKLNFSAEEIVLYKSTLTPQGPFYEAIHKASLKKT